MNSDVLVIFENEQVFPEALLYAREFALRINGPVTFLMLVYMSFAGSNLVGAKRHDLKKIGNRVNLLLEESSAPFIKGGLRINSALRIGDPAQELLKFLADRPPFKVIIWGSSQDLPFSCRSPGKHWLGRVIKSLECPLLTVKKRSSKNSRQS